MHVYTELLYHWDGQQYVLIHEEGFDLPDGFPVMLAKGATAAQEELQSAQTAFYNTMTKDYSQQFASQQAILGSLQAAWNPILQAGPNQYGFSAAQDATLRSQAVQGTAQTYEQAAKAVNTQLGGQGAGSELPSGAAEQLKQMTANTAANTESQEQLQITNAGYQQGYNMFGDASKWLGTVSAQMNPTGYSSAATSAGSAASTTANEIAQEGNQLWNTIGGALGGMASNIDPQQGLPF